LRNLIEMGFDEAKAKKALEIADGDAEEASELLI
jgi:translation elongation factor EF-Ts